MDEAVSGSVRTEKAVAEMWSLPQLQGRGGAASSRGSGSRVGGTGVHDKTNEVSLLYIVKLETTVLGTERTHKHDRVSGRSSHYSVGNPCSTLQVKGISCPNIYMSRKLSEQEARYTSTLFIITSWAALCSDALAPLHEGCQCPECICKISGKVVKLG